MHIMKTKAKNYALPWLDELKHITKNTIFTKEKKYYSFYEIFFYKKRVVICIIICAGIYM